MRLLSVLATEISDIYADGMLQKGPMHIAIKECFTGYIHSFHIRGMLAHYGATGRKEWLEAAKLWADWSIRMQGSYGDSDAYNMGYLFETESGIPKSWFIADTMDQAMALLNVAHLLNPADPLYGRIIDSILRFDTYIQKWNLGDDSFALGYMDGENLDKQSYHCAVARGISYYSAMSIVLGSKIFKARGIALLRHMLLHDDFNSNYHGSPLTNRCYASFALSDAYYVLADGDDILMAEVLKKMQDDIIPWAIENQTAEGYWIHDRFEGQPGATKPKQKKGIGPYTWGLLYGLEVFNRLLPQNDKLDNVINKSYNYMESSLEPGDINRWGHHAWGTMAIAVRLYPKTIFPMMAKV
jgi:hypothetical protein